MNSKRLCGKVSMTTGAGSGIGEAIAHILASKGAVSIVADIDLNSAASVAEKIKSRGGRARAVKLDVSDESSWQDTVKEILDHEHRLDILVNNAGVSAAKSVFESSFQDWRRVMAVNVDGVFLGTHYAIKAMSNGGNIVNIASVSGIKPPAGGASAYCASKAAIRMFSKVVAIECVDAKNDIRVNVVSPGGVKTPMWEKEEFFKKLVAEHGSVEKAFSAMSNDVPSLAFIEPEDVAKTVVNLVSDESSHLTGVEVVLDKGFHS